VVLQGPSTLAAGYTVIIGQPINLFTILLMILAGVDKTDSRNNSVRTHKDSHNNILHETLITVLDLQE